MKAILIRSDKTDKQTLGFFKAYDGSKEVFECNTLELPDKGNQPSISCIPVGEYCVTKHNSPSQGDCFKIHDVPGREHILIHVANYVRQLRGCIAPGLNFVDIDGDGELDVTTSRKTLQRMLNVLPDEFTLKIIEL